MLRDYHRKIVERAESAVATGSLSTIMIEMQRQATPWAIPAAIAVIACFVTGLSGKTALLFAFPLVAVSIFGSCIYSGWIFARAIMRARGR
ncbi:MAG: hypothetical protein KGP14_13160 [Betaproteobacteria bacterium]|nr:hypothetical protein [Betaproteobacteria bacterium]